MKLTDNCGTISSYLKTVQFLSQFDTENGTFLYETSVKEIVPFPYIMMFHCSNILFWT